jgi:hypothetical protein
MECAYYFDFYRFCLSQAILRMKQPFPFAVLVNGSPVHSR